MGGGENKSPQIPIMGDQDIIGEGGEGIGEACRQLKSKADVKTMRGMWESRRWKTVAAHIKDGRTGWRGGVRRLNLTLHCVCVLGGGRIREGGSRNGACEDRGKIVMFLKKIQNSKLN